MKSRMKTKVCTSANFRQSSKPTVCYSAGFSAEATALEVTGAQQQHQHFTTVTVIYNEAAILSACVMIL